MTLTPYQIMNLPDGAVMKYTWGATRKTPVDWFQTNLPKKHRTFTYKKTTHVDSEWDALFGEAWEWASENIPHEDWTVAQDEFVFKYEKDAAYFIMRFCL